MTKRDNYKENQIKVKSEKQNPTTLFAASDAQQDKKKPRLCT